MYLRELFLMEAGLEPSELKKHDFKYLRVLADMGTTPLDIVPEKRDRYGKTVVMTQYAIDKLKELLARDPVEVPYSLPVYPFDGTGKEPIVIPTSAILKTGAYTGRVSAEGEAKEGKGYNAGAIAELIMGLCVSAKFFNLGRDITTQQVIDMAGHLDTRVEPTKSSSVYVFSTTRVINYPDRTAKSDTLNYSAKIPSAGSEKFIEFVNRGELPKDLTSILASAVMYCNESDSVSNACAKVKADKNNNAIDVLSDGTGDAKLTKADLTLKIDGQKVNLLSLKTYASDTLGQASGVGFENLQKFFNIGFGIDISNYQTHFAEERTKEERHEALYDLYKTVIFPQVSVMLEDQSPGVEAAIVSQLARAANIFARGEALEDVEVVKLDDKITSGGYKILRFSDDLIDAMKHLDLYPKMVGKGTVQIWVRPNDGSKPMKLMQFRSQVMGGNMRNYFESGPMLEELTDISKKKEQAPKNRQSALRTGAELRSLK